MTDLQAMWRWHRCCRVAALPTALSAPSAVLPVGDGVVNSAAKPGNAMATTTPTALHAEVIAVSAANTSTLCTGCIPRFGRFPAHDA